MLSDHFIIYTKYFRDNNTINNTMDKTTTIIIVDNRSRHTDFIWKMMNLHEMENLTLLTHAEKQDEIKDD